MCDHLAPPDLPGGIVGTIMTGFSAAYCHAFCWRIVGGLLFLLALTLNAGAQINDDAVHILPRGVSKHEKALPLPADPALLLRTRPLQKDVDLVLVPVTVTNPDNRPVNDLPAQAFSVSEDGVQQQVQYFTHEDSPISIGLILDLSGSMKNKVEYVREALKRFLENANIEDDYCAVLVGSRPELLATSADPLDKLSERLADIQPGGSTSLFDAIYLGVSRMRHAHYQRRALLIISDGADNSSRYTLKEIRNVVAESDVMVYAIGIFDNVALPLFKTMEERMGRKWLDEITDAGGGRDLPADKRNKIPEIAAQISRELRSQYVLGYRPTRMERDGKWRKITVRLDPSAQAAHLHAQYKKGYYAPNLTYAQAQ